MFENNQKKKEREKERKKETNLTNFMKPNFSMERSPKAISENVGRFDPTYFLKVSYKNT
jgi:hypothetical protein